MADPLGALSSLAERVDAENADALQSERAVQLRAAEPLLEILGWDVRGPAVVPQAEVGDATVAYLLSIDGTPAVAVSTAAPGDETLDVEPIETAVETGSVGRGLATDGERITLIVRQDGALHRRSFAFGELPANAEAVEQFHRSVLERSMDQSRTDRTDAARRLASNRDAVVDSVQETIVETTGPAIRDVVAEETERAIDAMLDRLDAQHATEADGLDRNGGSSKAASTSDSEADAASTIGDRHGNHGGQETGSEESPPPTEQSASPAAAESPPDTTGSDPIASTADGETEYVARFFGGSSSVGAVGTASPGATTAGVVRYLVENHELANAVQLPWRTDGGIAILAGSPGGDDWASLRSETGEELFVRPVGDPATAKTAIEGLADACGLRVMFQGDW